MEGARGDAVIFVGRELLVALKPGVLLLTSVDVPSGAPAERVLKSNCNVFGISQEAAFLASITEILNRQLGFGESLRQGVSMLGDGRPIPLISYSLTEYLLSLDLSAFDVLELGGGQSTYFWSKKARSVCTVEHDPQWVGALRAAGLRNGRIVQTEADSYAAAIAGLSEQFDLIVIDCAANRYECAIAAGCKLRAGGLIILDNSDWYPNTAAHLRSLDLIQVDFPDFRPSHHYRCTTSIFLHPAFRPAALQRAFPPTPIGGKEIAAVNSWDFPEAQGGQAQAQVR